jgi:tetratricopeptide (TPR) repeat protein
MVVLLLLAACAEAPKQPAPPPPPAPVPQPVEPPAPPPPPPPEPVREPTGAEKQQAQTIALAAVGLLGAGNEMQAAAELKRALALDPANKLAISLSRQISEDPQLLYAQYGRDSFAYAVKPGESLSAIAERFLGDKYAFYGLARFNDIKVPRQVAGGQSIRVPGKAPPTAAMAEPVRPAKPRPPEPTNAPADPVPAAAAPASPPPPDPGPSPAEKAFRNGEALEKTNSLDKALAEYKVAAALGYAAAPAKVQGLTAKLVDSYSRAARAALARQDLDAAIRAWDRVLDLSPGNQTAQLERQKVLRLQEALNRK